MAAATSLLGRPHAVREGGGGGLAPGLRSPYPVLGRAVVPQGRGELEPGAELGGVVEGVASRLDLKVGQEGLLGDPLVRDRLGLLGAQGQQFGAGGGRIVRRIGGSLQGRELGVVRQRVGPEGAREAKARGLDGGLAVLDEPVRPLHLEFRARRLDLGKVSRLDPLRRRDPNRLRQIALGEGEGEQTLGGEEVRVGGQGLLLHVERALSIGGEGGGDRRRALSPEDAGFPEDVERLVDEQIGAAHDVGPVEEVLSEIEPRGGIRPGGDGVSARLLQPLAVGGHRPPVGERLS